jgi:murein L,D-transpeptidase YafK
MLPTHRILLSFHFSDGEIKHTTQSGGPKLFQVFFKLLFIMTKKHAFNEKNFFSTLAHTEDAINQQIISFKEELREKYLTFEAFKIVWRKNLKKIVIQNIASKQAIVEDINVASYGDVANFKLVGEQKKKYDAVVKKYSKEAKDLEIHWRDLLVQKHRNEVIQFLSRFLNHHFKPIFDTVRI